MLKSVLYKAKNIRHIENTFYFYITDLIHTDFLQILPVYDWQLEIKYK